MMLSPFVVTCALALAQTPTPSKKPRKAPPVSQAVSPAPVAPEVEQAALLAAFSRAFDMHGEAVANCVLETSPGDPDWVQVVKATAVVNSEGQLFSLEVVLEPVPPAGDAMRGCVEKVLRGASWPKAVGPMASCEHSWTFMTQ